MHIDCLLFLLLFNVDMGYCIFANASSNDMPA